MDYWGGGGFNPPPLPKYLHPPPLPTPMLIVNIVFLKTLSGSIYMYSGFMIKGGGQGVLKRKKKIIKKKKTDHKYL